MISFSLKSLRTNSRGGFEPPSIIALQEVIAVTWSERVHVCKHDVKTHND